MLNIYVTYDKISEEYSQPWFAKNDNVAIRNMRIASQREALPLDDIKLYCLGVYNSEEGKLYENTLQADFEPTEIDLSGISKKKE